MTELLVFSQAAESLQRALGDLLDGPAKARFKALGLDYERPLDPAYPLERWRRVVEVAGELVAPGASYEVQQYELGSRFITAYTETVIGRATLALTRVLGPRRTLERMAKTLRMGNNYSQTQLTARGPTEYELWCNHVQNPSFYRGMLRTGLMHAGVPGVQVTTAQLDARPSTQGDAEAGSGATFHISW